MDAKISKILTDGRSKANRQANKFLHGLIKSFSKRGHPAAIEFLGGIRNNYCLMITLWDEIEAGEKSYLDSYLKIRAELRKDLSSLQILSGNIRGLKEEQPEKEKENSIDLSLLSLPLKLVLRALIQIGHGSVITDQDMREFLFTALNSLDPEQKLIEYRPRDEYKIFDPEIDEDGMVSP